MQPRQVRNGPPTPADLPQLMFRGDMPAQVTVFSGQDHHIRGPLVSSWDSVKSLRLCTNLNPYDGMQYHFPASALGGLSVAGFYYLRERRYPLAASMRLKCIFSLSTLMLKKLWCCFVCRGRNGDWRPKIARFKSSEHVLILTIRI